MSMTRNKVNSFSRDSVITKAIIHAPVSLAITTAVALTTATPFTSYWLPLCSFIGPISQVAYDFASTHPWMKNYSHMAYPIAAAVTFGSAALVLSFTSGSWHEIAGIAQLAAFAATIEVVATAVTNKIDKNLPRFALGLFSAASKPKEQVPNQNLAPSHSGP
jgi:hypothetical protein